MELSSALSYDLNFLGGTTSESASSPERDLTMTRRTKILLAAAILLAALIFVVPILINVDHYRGQLISYLQQKTGKQIEIGRLSLTFLPLSIQVDGFGVKNPPLFPRGYVLHVARIYAGLDSAPLFHRRVVIKSLVLDNPVIHLISDPDGPWNFENPQAKSSQYVFPLEPIANVQIKRGEVIASSLLPSDAPGPVLFEAHDVSSDLANVNLEAILNPSSSSVDGQGTLKAGRLRFGSVHATNLNTNLRLETLVGDIEHSSHPLAGMRGAGHVTVRNGEVPSLELNANLMKLMHFNDLGPAKNNPSSFNLISTDLQLANLRIASTKIDIDGYGVDIDGSGSVSVSGSDTLDYRGNAQITTKQGFFTNTFGRLSGGKLVDGKLTFPFRISGTIQNPIFSKVDDDK